MTRLWMVRLGKFGEQEAHALETGELVTGWSGLRDFSANQVREEIAGAVEETYKEQKAGTLQNWPSNSTNLRIRSKRAIW